MNSPLKTASSAWKIKSVFFFMCLIVLMGVCIYPFFESQKKEDLALTHEPPIANKSLLAQFLDIPLYFEKNEGQMDPDFHYVTRCPGLTLYFAPQAVSLFLKHEHQEESPSVLNIQFVGSNPHSIIKGIDEQECKSNYFIGGDSTKWHTDISNYRKIVYQGLYPGIDALFYGNGKQLEYDFLVAPGMNPDHVRMRIDGAQELALDEEGNLQIIVGDEQIFQMKKPSIYQVIEGKKNDVKGEFTLLAKREIGFSLNNYDKTQQLVIDPILAYSTYVGGSAFDTGGGIAVDSSNNVYVVGQTSSANFPTTSGAFQTFKSANPVAAAAFVTKFNSTGTALIYSTYLGGSSDTNGVATAVNENGNAYITGNTFANDFPTTAGAFQTSKMGGAAGNNGFITQLNSTGSALIYSTYLGASSSSCASIVLDESGNAYVTGNTGSTIFPTTSGAFQTARSPGSTAADTDVFISKLNSAGSALIYSTYLGGSASDSGNDIFLDGDGNAYVTGNTNSLNFPTTSGAFQTLKGGTAAANNAFLTKLNITGSSLVYSTYLGGISNTSNGNSVVVDESFHAYVVGNTNSQNFPTTNGAFQTLAKAAPGFNNGFVSKFNPAGSALVYSTYLGGAAITNTSSIALNSQNEVYLTGNTSSTDFPTTPDAYQPFLAGTNNAFVTKLNSAGSALIYSTYLGGVSGVSIGRAIALDSDGSAYIAGTTSSTTFPVTTDAFQTTLGGSNDVFVAKFNIGTPTITGVAPNVGPPTGQTIVTITGTNFANATAVYFGETAATTFVIDSDTQITVLSPPHALGSVDITVEAIGVSTITSADQFTYQTLPTTTFLIVSPNPAKERQTVTVVASVSSSSATGSMTFFDGEKLLGVKAVVNGKASFTTDSLTVGKHFIIASYSGDNVYTGSMSQVEHLIIKARIQKKSRR